ncbi:MAG: hypothetical protein COU72_01960 [Parcubacteria group bacterium CG10_big_fil_rev_8_21_14_0_10_41_35]|nr:MAG: hypothetical protein COU72_01960 [Parcubacteria group bacterium CG10_big_fil_rev_8_21_14_0_10_41_35]
MGALIGALIVKGALVIGFLAAIAGVGFTGYAGYKGYTFINDNQNKKEVQASPSQIPQTLPSPPSKPSPKPVIQQTSGVNSNLIDCTGPDKMVFKTTQKACDDFNSAWGNTNTAISATDVSSQQKTYFCKTYSDGFKLYTKDKSGCDTLQADINNSQIRQNNFNSCMDSKKQVFDNCSSDCKTTSNNDLNICAWAYTGINATIKQDSGLYSECLNESSKEHELCLKTCSANHSEAIKSCGGR